jgi:hypothetical protein
MDSSKVTELIEKAAKADRPDDAMKFAQAALNAAHALQVLKGA